MWKKSEGISSGGHAVTMRSNKVVVVVVVVGVSGGVVVGEEGEATRAARAREEELRTENRRTVKRKKKMKTKMKIERIKRKEECTSTRVVLDERGFTGHGAALPSARPLPAIVLR